MKYFLPLIIFITLIFSNSISAKKGLCEAAYDSDFDRIESIIESKIKEIQREDSLVNNYAKLEGLANWLKKHPCVKDAEWNKNQAYILTTLTFVNSMGVIFRTRDSTAEMCFQIQTHTQFFGETLYWRFGVDIPDRRLRYKGFQFCKGFIQSRRTMDSLNARNRILEKHNYSVRFGLAIVSRNGGSDYYHIKPEGEAIYVKLTVANISDSLKIIPWPIHQNHGLKLIYFSVYSKFHKHIFTENRSVNLDHNEIITYDLLRLEPGEEKVFYHVINGDCLDRNTRIECHHNLGLIREGEYYLNAWYNPFGPDYGPEVWLPREMDSLGIRSDYFFRVARDGNYYVRTSTLGAKNPDNMEIRSDAILDIELMGRGAAYYSKIGEMIYDGWGIVKSVQKGNLEIGDTIAFTVRNEEDLKSLDYLEVNAFYRICASWSNAHCFQIPEEAFLPREKGSTRNFQLINFPGGIKKISKP